MGEAGRWRDQSGRVWATRGCVALRGQRKDMSCRSSHRSQVDVSPPQSILESDGQIDDLTNSRRLYSLTTLYILQCQ